MLPLLSNFSPFPADVAAGLDPHARQHYLVVVSATFEAAPGQGTRIAETQMALADVDVHYGEPGKSSVKYDADYAFEKPLVDVVVNGTAYVPHGRPTSQAQIGIRVGRVLEKILTVTGDRFWRRGVLGLAPSSPELFTTMPIVYERAYGGSTGDALERRNPVGIGFSGASSPVAAIQSEVPNIEYPDSVMRSRSDKPRPAGFGAISRSWIPRIGFAGTYDDKWKDEQFPLLPLDFDSRFFQSAPDDQQVKSISGEVVHIANMTPDGHWSFVVPRLTVPIHLRYSDNVEEIALNVDTLLIEPDRYMVTLKGRSRVPVRRNVPPLQEVVVGHATPAFWRARLSGKQYLASVDGHTHTGTYFTT